MSESMRDDGGKALLKAMAVLILSLTLLPLVFLGLDYLVGGLPIPKQAIMPICLLIGGAVGTYICWRQYRTK